jgi:CDP-diacylglycerol--glycerol-3-phosphate 3-phosphatidyltransferase
MGDHAMPNSIDTKPIFQKFLRPATRRLAAAGITPNQVTVTTILLSLAGGGVVLALPGKTWPVLLIPAVLSLRVAFNHIDGMLACEHDMKTSLGAILNELADVMSDAALYLPLALVPGVAAVLLVPAVVLGILAEMIGVVATLIGADRREDGPMSKKPRGLVIGGSALAIGLGVPPGPWLHSLLLVMLPLQIVTIFNRLNRAVEQANKRCSTI